MPKAFKYLTQICLGAALAVPVSLPMAGPATAQDWEYTGFLYLWGSSTEGRTVNGQDFSVSFSELLESLDFGINAALEARNGRWSLLGDGLWLSVSDEGPPPAPGAPSLDDFAVKGVVFTGAGSYDVVSRPGSRFAVLGGFRYTNLDTTLNLTGAGGPTTVSSTLSNWDAIVGVRGLQQLGDRWSLAYYADIGAGESDLTWQVAASVDYQINNWALSVGYRHTAWEVGNMPALTDLSFSGPFFGAKFRF